MTGKCALCPVVDAPLSETYKGVDLGARLCSCCQLKVFNLRHKSPEVSPLIAYRFERMAEVSRRRAAAGRVSAPERPAPAPSPPRRAASWAAHSCPQES